MTHPENGKPLWSEAKVEALLEEFFRREMPPAVRDSDPAAPRTERSPMPAAQIESAKRRANSLAGLVMVGSSSLLMLMLGFLAWDASHPPDSGAPTQSTSESDESSPATPADPLKALKHDGQGPVELRSRIQNVGTEDSSDSPGGKADFPELDIEVYPPDQAPPEEANPILPEARPMPEEIRHLPEDSSL